MSILKDTAMVKSNATSVLSGLKKLFNAAIGATVIVTLAHDITTGDSLISKFWNSAVVANMENKESCAKNAWLHGSFICEKRGDGRGLETLVPDVPDFLK